MTDMRERLIELIGKEQEHGVTGYANFPTISNKELADHLIANGVILPPCKVGQTVYLIPTYGGKPYCGIVQDKVQMIGITSRGVHIKARSHHDHNKMYMLGKTVFLTREDAEKALKEREKV